MDACSGVQFLEPCRTCQARNFYIAFNMATRRSWRPPSKSVSSQIRTIFSARSSGIRRSPIESTFASLWCRESWADSLFQQSAQRTPWTLFATIASPLPEPPKTMPRSHSPRATASAAGRRQEKRATGRRARRIAWGKPSFGCERLGILAPTGRQVIARGGGFAKLLAARQGFARRLAAPLAITCHPFGVQNRGGLLPVAVGFRFRQ